MKPIFTGSFQAMHKINRFKKNNTPHDNAVSLVRGGREFFDTLEKIINEAEHFIHFQTYIFEADETGRRIQQALIGAASRNVKVFVLIDAYGSSDLPDEFVAEMKTAGINFRFFGPLFSQWSFHFGRRMHHKIVVVDSFISLAGGINISNRYNDLPGNPAWLDFAVLCRGPVSLDFLTICLHRWTRKKIKHIPKELLHVYKANFRKGTKGSFAYARENDALHNRTQITSMYRKAIRAAEKEIIIVGGYFIPGFQFRRSLKGASNRGVRIKFITGSDSDVQIAINATHFLYKWMLKHGFEIFEYKKSVVHGKVTVVDGYWTTVGSYDLNNLSAHANIEANVDIHDEDFAESVRNVLLRIIQKDCVQITPEYFQKREKWLTRLKWWSSYHFIGFLFGFSRTFFAGKGD